jgi:hypothetical protein
VDFLFGALFLEKERYMLSLGYLLGLDSSNERVTLTQDSKEYQRIPWTHGILQEVR